MLLRILDVQIEKLRTPPRISSRSIHTKTTNTRQLPMKRALKTDVLSIEDIYQLFIQSIRQGGALHTLSRASAAV